MPTSSPTRGLMPVFPEDSLSTALVDHIVTGVHIVEASDSLDNLSFLHKVFLNIIKYKDCSVLRTLTILPGFAYRGASTPLLCSSRGVSQDHIYAFVQAQAYI